MANFYNTNTNTKNTRSNQIRRYSSNAKKIEQEKNLPISESTKIILNFPKIDSKKQMEVNETEIQNQNHSKIQIKNKPSCLQLKVWEMDPIKSELKKAKDAHKLESGMIDNLLIKKKTLKLRETLKKESKLFGMNSSLADNTNKMIFFSTYQQNQNTNHKFQQTTNDLNEESFFDFKQNLPNFNLKESIFITPCLNSLLQENNETLENIDWRNDDVKNSLLSTSKESFLEKRHNEKNKLEERRTKEFQKSKEIAEHNDSNGTHSSSDLDKKSKSQIMFNRKSSEASLVQSRFLKPSNMDEQSNYHCDSVLSKFGKNSIESFRHLIPNSQFEEDKIQVSGNLENTILAKLRSSKNSFIQFCDSLAEMQKDYNLKIGIKTEFNETISKNRTREESANF